METCTRKILHSPVQTDEIAHLIDNGAPARGCSRLSLVSLILGGSVVFVAALSAATLLVAPSPSALHISRASWSGPSATHAGGSPPYRSIARRGTSAGAIHPTGPHRPTGGEPRTGPAAAPPHFAADATTPHAESTARGPWRTPHVPWLQGLLLAASIGAGVVALQKRVRAPARPTHVACYDVPPNGAGVSLHAVTGSPNPDQTFTLPAPAIFTPYIGRGERRTVCTELVPGSIWGFEQNQELSALTVNIRCTAVRLSDGALWVHAPVFPTAEFLAQLDALGPVRYIMLPTFALEHKLPIITFARKYPKAQVWAVPDTWSWPINLPLSLLGIRVHGMVGQTAPWSAEIEAAVLKIDDVGSPFVEAAFFHKASRTLLVTDMVYCIPRDPSPVVDPAKLLEVAPDDPTKPLADTQENRRRGWAKMALLVSYFIPARQRLVKGGKAEWQEGYMDSFESIVGKLIVSPILQALVLAKSRDLIMPWLEKVVAWDFETVIPAHYDAPVKAGPDEFYSAFGFVTGDPNALQLPEDDMRTLNDLQRIVKRAATGQGEVYTELFDKFFKNLFLEKSGWQKDQEP
uniref:DUF4336 domain-containing protein n=1 Tax=Eutreptiella gymnastica TaxID=73025 RepID=A0A7S4G9A2_9EUGL|mmetsp:Transcript_40364/g.67324  ORF Transcript_40364/g.67324 Transcript_40364/m.67324 type:complete len:575 (-) Transcript_40364:1064-2788(-)|eukprot:CAMPEP_0174299072 /NCGR_PEP_ID=MMETSP0809-20121228/55666_1 /TAXON_ID=73025 ORGANISM="Eutreptiella gymnastica-like, Strain CCMP1594" /NCGR_SAMPLE_ID=MMETSP0809 /ASSEMBLY_ACC=CAM_ASM_000658 /LENGTH=574 /DNA_ID=CAMNT_0015403993 /DNA_START=100 /DNA_END=1824 /DNA_ORIENTATION=+